MMNEELHIKIENFFDGKMSEEETLEFKQELKTNNALQEEVTLYKSLNFYLTDTMEDDDTFYDGAYREKLKSFIESTEGQEIKENLRDIGNAKSINENNNRIKRLLYFGLPIAATVMLFFGIFFLGKTTDSPTDLYVMYYKVSELPSFTSRSKNTSILSTAKSNFNSADFDASLSDFNTYIATNVEEIDPLIYIYTGLIYSEKNDFTKAIQEFEKLENSNHLDSSRALWYKVLVCLKFEKKDEAKYYLTLILKDKNNYKYKKARELLDKI